MQGTPGGLQAEPEWEAGLRLVACARGQPNSLRTLVRF